MINYASQDVLVITHNIKNVSVNVLTIQQDNENTASLSNVPCSAFHIPYPYSAFQPYYVFHHKLLISHKGRFE